MVNLQYFAVALVLLSSQTEAQGILDFFGFHRPSTSSKQAGLTTSTTSTPSYLTVYTTTTTETLTSTIASVNTVEQTVYERVIVDCDTYKPPVAEGLIQCFFDCSSLAIELTACLGSKSCMCPTARRRHKQVDTCLSCGAINWAIGQALKGCDLPPLPQCATLVTSKLTSYKTNYLTSYVTTTHPVTATSSLPISTSTVQGAIAGTLDYIGDDGFLRQRVTVVPEDPLPNNGVSLGSDGLPSYGTPVTTVTVVGDKAGTVTYVGDEDGIPTARVTVTPVLTLLTTGEVTGKGVTFDSDRLPILVVTETQIIEASVMGPIAGTTTEVGSNGIGTVIVTTVPTNPVGTTTVAGPSAGKETFKGADGLPYVRDTIIPAKTVTYVATESFNSTVIGSDGIATAYEIIGPQSTVYTTGTLNGRDIVFGTDGWPVIIVTIDPPVITETAYGLDEGLITFVGDDGLATARTTAKPTTTLTTWATVETIGVASGKDGQPVVMIYNTPTGPVATKTTYGLTSGIETSTGEDGLPTLMTTMPPKSTSTVLGPIVGTEVTLDGNGDPVKIVTATPTGPVTTQFDVGLQANTYTFTGDDGLPTERVVSAPTVTDYVLGPIAGVSLIIGDDGDATARYTTTPEGPVTTLSSFGLEATTFTTTGDDGLPTEQVILGPSLTKSVLGTVAGTTLSFEDDGAPVMVVTATPTAPVTTQFSYGLYPTTITITGEDGFPTERVVVGPSATQTVYGTVEGAALSFDANDFPIEVITVTPSGPVTTQSSFGLMATTYTFTGEDGLPTEQAVEGPSSTELILGAVEGTSLSFRDDGTPIMIVTATPSAPVTTQHSFGLYPTTLIVTGEDGFPTERVVDGPSATKTVFGTVEGVSLSFEGNDFPVEVITITPSGPVVTQSSFGLQATTFTFTGNDGLPTEQVVQGPSFTKSVLGTVEGTMLSFFNESLPIMIITATPTAPVTTQHSYGFYPTTFTVTGEDGFPTERVADGPSATKTVFGTVEGTALSFVGEDFPVEIITVIPSGPVTTMSSFGLTATTYIFTGEDGLPTEQVIEGPSLTKSILGTVAGTALSFGDDGNPVMIVTATPTAPVTTQISYGLQPTTFTTTGDDGFPTERVVLGPSATHTVFGTIGGTSLLVLDEFPIEIITVVPTGPVTTQSSFGFQGITYTLTGEDGLPTEQVVLGPSATTSVLGTAAGSALSFGEDHLPILIVTETPTGPVTTQFSYGSYPTTITTIGADGFPTERVVKGPSATQTIYGTVEGTSISFDGDDFPVEIITVIPTGPVTTLSSFGLQGTTYTFIGDDGLPTEQIIQGPSFTRTVLGTVPGTNMSLAAGSIPIMVITATPTAPVTTQISYGLHSTTFTITGEDGFPTERVVKGPSATQTVFGAVEGTALSFDGEEFLVEIVTVTPSAPVATQSSFGLNGTTFIFTGDDGLPTEQVIRGPSFTKSVLGTAAGTSLSFGEEGVPMMIITATPTAPVTTQLSYGLNSTTFIVTGEDGFPTEKIVEGPYATKTVFGTVEGISLSMVDNEFPVKIITVVPSGPVSTQSSFGLQGTTYTFTGEDGLPTEKVVLGPSSTKSVFGTNAGTMLSIGDDGIPVLVVTAMPTAAVTTQHTFGLYPTTFVTTGEDGYPTEHVVLGPSATQTVYGTVEGTSIALDKDFPIEIITVTPSGPVTTQSSFGLNGTTYTATGEDGLPTEQVVKGPSSTTSLLGTAAGTVLSFGDDDFPIMIVTATPTGPVNTQFSYGLYPTTITTIGKDGFPTERVVKGPSSTQTVYGTVEGTAISFIDDNFPVEIITVIPSTPVTSQSSFGLQATVYTFTGKDGLPTEQIVNGPSFTKSVFGTVPGTELSLAAGSIPVMIVTASPTEPVTTQYSYGLFPTTSVITGGDGYPTEVIVLGPSATRSILGTVEGTALSYDSNGFPVEVITATPSAPVATQFSYGLQATTFNFTGEDGLPTEQVIQGPSSTTSVLGTIVGTALSFREEGDPVMVVTATPTAPITTQHSFGLYPTTLTFTGEDGFPTEQVVDSPYATKTVFGTVEGVSLSFNGNNIPVEIVTVIPLEPVTTQYSFGLEATNYTFTGEDGLPTEQVIKGPSTTMSTLSTSAGTLSSFGDDSAPVMIVTATPKAPGTTQFSYGFYPTTITTTGDDGFPTERVILGPSSTQTVFGTTEGAALSFDLNNTPVEIITVIPSGPVTTLTSYGIHETKYTFIGEDGLPTVQVLKAHPFTTKVFDTIAGTSMSLGDDGISMINITTIPTAAVTTDHSIGLYPTTMTVTGENDLTIERSLDGESATNTVIGKSDKTSLSDGLDPLATESIKDITSAPVATQSPLGPKTTTSIEDDLPTENAIRTSSLIEIFESSVEMTNASSVSPVTTQSIYGLHATTFTTTGEDGSPTERVTLGPSATKTVFGTAEGTELVVGDDNLPTAVIIEIPSGPVTNQSTFGFDSTTYIQTGDDGLLTEHVTQAPSAAQTINGNVEGSTLEFSEDGLSTKLVTVLPSGAVASKTPYDIEATTLTEPGQDGLATEHVIQGSYSTSSIVGTAEGTLLTLGTDSLPISIVTATTVPVILHSTPELVSTSTSSANAKDLTTENAANTAVEFANNTLPAGADGTSSVDSTQSPDNGSLESTLDIHSTTATEIVEHGIPTSVVSSGATMIGDVANESTSKDTAPIWVVSEASVATESSTDVVSHLSFLEASKTTTMVHTQTMKPDIVFFSNSTPIEVAAFDTSSTHHSVASNAVPSVPTSVEVRSSTFTEVQTIVIPVSETSIETSIISGPETSIIAVSKETSIVSVPDKTSIVSVLESAVVSVLETSIISASGSSTITATASTSALPMTSYSESSTLLGTPSHGNIKPESSRLADTDSEEDNTSTYTPGISTPTLSTPGSNFTVDDLLKKPQGSTSEPTRQISNNDEVTNGAIISSANTSPVHLPSTTSVSFDAATPSQVAPPVEGYPKPMQANGGSSHSIPFTGLLTTAIFFILFWI
jgi:hypothetical protein